MLLSFLWVKLLTYASVFWIFLLENGPGIYMESQGVTGHLAYLEEKLEVRSLHDSIHEIIVQDSCEEIFLFGI